MRGEPDTEYFLSSLDDEYFLSSLDEVLGPRCTFDETRVSDEDEVPT